MSNDNPIALPANFNTDCVHAGCAPDPAHGAVMTPLYLSSTFAFKDVGQPNRFDYTRSGNPTRAALEDAIAQLEGADGCTAVATGMAAVTVALNLFATCDHIIVTNDCYGGTFRLLQHLVRQFSLKVSYVDLSDLRNLEAAWTPATKAVWVETPSNPLLNLIDIAAVADFAKARNALTIVDNTFCTPTLQQPIALGADIVVHSTTKYLNGHSDVVGGAICAKSKELTERIAWLSNCLGVTEAPFDAFMVLRGLKTLGLRMQAHERNANAVAHFLDAHAAVEHVYYPGLESHPQHALAKRQQRGFGGMVSFRVAGGIENVNHVLRTTKVFTLAESLGGVESLLCHPASMTHASMAKEARDAAGITDGVIRLSIGIEDSDALIADLAQALNTLPVAIATNATAPANVEAEPALQTC